MKRLELLVVRGGALSGRRFQVRESGVRLGRSSSNDIPIPDEELSRSHCLFELFSLGKIRSGAEKSEIELSSDILGISYQLEKLAFKEAFKLLFVNDIGVSLGDKSLGAKALDLVIQPVGKHFLVVAELQYLVCGATPFGGGGLLI